MYYQLSIIENTNLVLSNRPVVFTKLPTLLITPSLIYDTLPNDIPFPLQIMGSFTPATPDTETTSPTASPAQGASTSYPLTVPHPWETRCIQVGTTGEVRGMTSRP